MGNQNSGICTLCKFDQPVIDNNDSFTMAKTIFKNFKIQDQWSSILSKLKKNVKDSFQNKGILGNQALQIAFSCINGYYLNQNQKNEFLQIIALITKTNFENHEHKYSQFQFCQDIGQKIYNFQNRIYLKHKYCLQYSKFQVSLDSQTDKYYAVQFPELKFDMSRLQIQIFAGIIDSFCQNNLQAFAFVTLYFLHCINNFLKDDDESGIGQISENFENQLKNLEITYPANVFVSYFRQNEINVSEYIKNSSYEKLIFEQSNKSHIQQLKQFIIKKAENAKKEESLFIDLVSSVCLQKGYGFKSEVKIKNQDDSLSIMRVIEKLLDKQKYEHYFEKLKQDCINTQASISKKYQNRLKNFVEWEQQKVKQKIQQILQQQNELQFDLKDLLTGKCFFSTKKDINQTVASLRQKIVEHNYTLSELKNRLDESTKDIALVIMLPHSVAQLQLTLKLNTVQNQFNHKIYQLLRSKMYTPITNLFILNQKWCNQFFIEQKKVFDYFILNGQDIDFEENVTFRKLQNKVKIFEKKYLRKDLIVALNADQNSIQTQKLQQSIINIHQIIQKGSQDANFIRKSQTRIINELSFYLNSNSIEKAKQLLEKHNNQYQQNDNFLYYGGYINLKFKKSEEALTYFLKSAQIKEKNQEKNQLQMALMYQNIGRAYHNLGNYQKAIQYAEKTLNIYKRQKNQQITSNINLYNLIGLIYFKQGDYAKAIENQQKCIEILQKNLGKQNIQSIPSMINLGAIYRNKGDYFLSLFYYQKSLSIQQKYKGKQNISCGDILNSMGLVYENQYNFQRALDCYNKNIQIQERVYGKDSIQCGPAINSIAVLYLKKIQYEKAHQYLNKSLQICQRVKGKKSIDAALALVNIGQVYRQEENNQKALQSYFKALKIYQEVMGKQSIECVAPLMNIGMVYSSQKKLEKSKSYYLRALNIQKNIKGQFNLDASTIYINLALLEQQIGHLQNSLEYSKKSYQARRKILGQNHPKTKNSLNQISFMNIKLKKTIKNQQFD